MDSSSKTRIRHLLLQLGMTRLAFTQDNGDGKYSEQWSNGTDSIRLQWKRSDGTKPPAHSEGDDDSAFVTA